MTVRKSIKKNSCYTYFRISGDFELDEITNLLHIVPDKTSFNKGGLRKNGTRYAFSSWICGRCDEYDVFVEKQMLKTIQLLHDKVDILNEIKRIYDAEFCLEIVPSIHVNETVPCLAPSLEIMKFCCATGTNIDIDLYVG